MVLEILALFPRLAPFKVITLDDGWDQLNRSFMFILCVLFGSIVTIRCYTGSVIECDGFVKVPDEFAKDYCWTQGIYTIREAYDVPGDAIPYPGIFPEDAPTCLNRDLKNGGRVICPPAHRIQKLHRVYHAWYQFVAFYFWTASCGFFIPYMMFKFFGMSDLKPVIAMLHNPVENAEDLKRLIDKAARWMFVRYQAYMGANDFWGLVVQKHLIFFTIVSTKTLYLIVSVLTMWLTEKMFHIGSFISYGSAWATERPDGDNFTGTLMQDKLFPKMAACEIKRWGPTGLEEEQGMCVLASNVINQYLFLIFWGALVITIICNVLSLLFAFSRLLFITGAYRRLLGTAFLKDEVAYHDLFYNSGTSGRVILQLIASNVNPKIFEHLINELLYLLRKANSDESERQLSDESNI